MILISVKSEVMTSKRQFEKDLDAERFLKRVKRLHDLCRIHKLRFEHPNFNGKNKGRRSWAFNRIKAKYAESLSLAIPLRVEIINTKANQLNFLSKLK